MHSWESNIFRSVAVRVVVIGVFMYAASDSDLVRAWDAERSPDSSQATIQSKHGGTKPASTELILSCLIACII